MLRVDAYTSVSNNYISVIIHTVSSCVAGPLYPAHLWKISRAYAMVGTPKAAQRRVVVLSAGRTAGRSSEISWMTYDGLSWDVHFRQVVAEVPMSKGSKHKLSIFSAGSSVDSDWFTAFGDYLIMQTDSPTFSDEEPQWLFPALQTSGSPGTTVGTYIKALLPKVHAPRPHS